MSLRQKQIASAFHHVYGFEVIRYRVAHIKGEVKVSNYKYMNKLNEEYYLKLHPFGTGVALFTIDNMNKMLSENIWETNIKFKVINMVVQKPISKSRNSVKEITDILVNDASHEILIQDCLDKGIPLPNISEDVNRIINVTLQGNHRL